jgi:hypothetical protein
MQLRNKRNQLFIERIQYLPPIPILVWVLSIKNGNPQPVGQQVIGEVAQGNLSNTSLITSIGCVVAFSIRRGGLEKLVNFGSLVAGALLGLSRF